MTEREVRIINGKEVALYRHKELDSYLFAEDAVDLLLKAFEEVEQYRAIGTVEEIKALKEKNTPQRVIDIKKSECPEDIKYFGSDELFGKCPHCDGMVNHTWNPCSCGDCGGLIDWSE